MAKIKYRDLEITGWKICFRKTLMVSQITSQSHTTRKKLDLTSPFPQSRRFWSGINWDF